ncbi:MAG: hypothetical protein ACE5KF_10655 [Kiloniellaceae bacterium]
MRRLRYGLSALFLVLALALAGPPAAAEEPGGRPEAEEMAREAMEQLLRALELFIESIPQYEMPEVNENGDIIIRRKRRPGDREQAEPEVEKTRI